MAESSAPAQTRVLSRADWVAAGREVRTQVPRAALAKLDPHGRDPLGILARQDAQRVPELVPLRAERMAASPFAFYRGTAAIMAADLAREPHTGILVASCGDAHISNFGFYASPQRTLMFDLNDFDEAAWAPWEWDLKRLVASVVIGARGVRDAAVGERSARDAVLAYTRALRAAVAASPLERYYFHLDPKTTYPGLDASSRTVLKRAIKDAKRRTGDRAVRKLTAPDAEGRVRFVESPPTTTRAEPEVYPRMQDAFAQYLASANVDVRLLLRQYVLRDVVRRVVGVGSVGTRCYLSLLDTGDDEAFILQVKEAGLSVLEEHGGIAQPEEVRCAVDEGGQGARVVGMQRILQAASDPFLGHLRGGHRDYYVRQFHDMKGGIDTDALEDEAYRDYAVACAVILARAHAQSENAGAIVGYLGRGAGIAESLLQWADAYAALSEADYRAFVAARGLPAPGPARA